MTKTDIVSSDYWPIEPARPQQVIKYKNIAVVYRGLGWEIPDGKVFEIKGDRWYFLNFAQAAYMHGVKFDLIMLFDGITQNEVINDSGFTPFQPLITPETVILEAG